MSKVCIVCGNKSSKTDREVIDPLKKVSYHKIPMNPERCKKWLSFCGLTAKPNNHNKFVCSDHFETKYLERDLRSELLDGVKRMILSKDAIPTIKKPRQTKRTQLQLEEEQRKERQKEVEKLLSGIVPKPIQNPFRQKQFDAASTEQNTQKRSIKSAKTLQPNKKLKTSSIRRIQDGSSETDTETETTEPAEVEQVFISTGSPKTGKPLICISPKKIDRVTALERENQLLKSKVTALEQLVEKKNEKINLAKTEMVNITVALQELKDIENRNLNIRVREWLKDIFTQNQIQRMLKTADDIEWSSEEMMRALVLRLYGLDVYSYVTDQLRYPLPTTTEMEQWIHDSYLQTGLLIPVLTVLQAFGRNLEQRDKECVLLLGRTKATPKYTYDSARDQIIDNDGYFYCICVQGLFADWHQIIYVDFDLIYSAELMVALVNQLYEIGFNVVAISGPCDQETVDLWAEFDVTVDHHYFAHPKTEQPVYLFACSITTLAVIHQVLLRGGFLVQDDVIVKKNVLEKLLYSEHPEILQNLKITKHHLSSGAVQDDNIELSEQLISNETTRALKILSEEGEESVSVMATMFEVFRDWYEQFKVPFMEQETEKDVSITHQPYGRNIDEQNLVLDGMFDTMESLKCINTQSDYLQHAVLVSINSLRKLLADVRKSSDLESIATVRLTSQTLTRIFCHFQKVHLQQLCPVNTILQQLSIAIANHDPLSVTNKVLSRACLHAGLRAQSRASVKVDDEIANVTEKEACSFLTNYVAGKLLSKYEYLGFQTFVIERKDNNYVVMPELPTGQVEPSGLWTEQAKKLEKYVTDITFYRNENVIENVVNSIARRHPKMGVDIIRLFVEKRLMIKLNNLNKELEPVC